MKRLLLILCLTAVFLASCGGEDVSLMDNPVDGTYSLTASALTVDIDESPDYVLYTNSTRIAVTVPDGAVGTVTLYDAASDALVGTVSFSTDTPRTATFSNLSAAYRYRIACEGFMDGSITISDGT